MKTRTVLFCLIVVLLAAGCTTTRSISNSSRTFQSSCFPGNPPSDPAFAYRGELSEFDVLAIDATQTISDADIQRALANPAFASLRQGSSILLVQSGAVFPDAPMVAALSRNFRVVPFSGVPRDVQLRDGGPGAYSRLLRMAAARGGTETIVCYWGILESGTQDLRTKTVSWVPLTGWMVPDQREHMRIRLKIALIDVRTGSWTVFTPTAFQDRLLSTNLSRESADQKLVERLKRQAYEASARELVAQYSR